MKYIKTFESFLNEGMPDNYAEMTMEDDVFQEITFDPYDVNVKKDPDDEKEFIVTVIVLGKDFKSYGLEIKDQNKMYFKISWMALNGKARVDLDVCRDKRCKNCVLSKKWEGDLESVGTPGFNVSGFVGIINGTATGEWVPL